MPFDGSIQEPVYKPAVRTITAITKSPRALVTTSFDHGYISGTIVRIIVPNNFGMTQINNLSGTIQVTSPTQFEIDIDTQLFDDFVVPSYNPGHNGTSAQSVPIGEVNEMLRAALKNVLPYT